MCKTFKEHVKKEKQTDGLFNGSQEKLFELFRI